MGLIKRNGASSAIALARSLKVSAMAVRQHLYALQEQRLVAFEEKSGGVGRPLKEWRLTKGRGTLLSRCARGACRLVGGWHSF